MKTVHVIGYQFDCLPGHVSIAGRGQGSNIRAAVGAAVRNVLSDSKLRRKHLGGFKLSVVVIGNGTGNANGD